LWIVSLLFFLSAVSREGGPLRWRGILVGITLLLGLWDEDADTRSPPPTVGEVSEEDRKDDRETGDRDADARSDAESFPANDITINVVITISVGHCG